MLVETNGISIIGIGFNPELGGTESIKEGFNGEVEEDRGNRVPLGDSFTDREGGT